MSMTGTKNKAASFSFNFYFQLKESVQLASLILYKKELAQTEATDD